MWLGGKALACSLVRLVQDPWVLSSRKKAEGQKKQKKRGK